MSENGFPIKHLDVRRMFRDFSIEDVSITDFYLIDVFKGSAKDFWCFPAILNRMFLSCSTVHVSKVLGYEGSSHCFVVSSDKGFKSLENNTVKVYDGILVKIPENTPYEDIKQLRRLRRIAWRRVIRHNTISEFKRIPLTLLLTTAFIIVTWLAAN